MKNWTVKSILVGLLIFTPYRAANAQQIFLGIGHVFLNAFKLIPDAVKHNKNTKLYSSMAKKFEYKYKDDKVIKSQCIKGFEALGLNRHQYIPSEENSFPFRNHAEPMVYKIPNPFGYCWGHARSTQKMTRLAFFRPDLKVPYERGSKQWRKFYRKVIRNINKNSAQVIPGYKNIKEFTSDELILPYIANMVQNSWARVAMTIPGLKAGLQKQNTIEEKKNIVNSIRTRLRRYQTPMVTMHYLDENWKNTHIVVIWKEMLDADKIEFCSNKDNHDFSSEENCLEHYSNPNIIRFCARDNNSEYTSNQRCVSQLVIYLDAQYPIDYFTREKYDSIYTKHSRVGVRMSYQEDIETIDMVDSISKLCKSFKEEVEATN